MVKGDCAEIASLPLLDHLRTASGHGMYTPASGRARCRSPHLPQGRPVRQRVDAVPGETKVSRVAVGLGHVARQCLQALRLQTTAEDLELIAPSSITHR